MRTNTKKHHYNPPPGDTWCRECNCTAVEHETLEFLNEDELHDYVTSHGEGAPTPDGVTLAYELWAHGDDYATIGHEIVHRGLVQEDLTCDMTHDCRNPVTHIDNKGYVYCTTHGSERRGVRPCRKLHPSELAALKRGEVVANY